MPAESIEGKNLLELDIPVACTSKEVEYISALKVEKTTKHLVPLCFSKKNTANIENTAFSFWRGISPKFSIIFKAINMFLSLTWFR